MASNERKNARKEKLEKKNKKKRTILWIFIIIIIAVLLILKVCEIDFKDIKNNFVDKNGKFSFSATVDKNAYPYTLDTARNVCLNVINDKLNILTDTSVTVLNPANGKELYTFDHGYAEPVMAHSGSYFCVFDQGGTRLRLDTNSENKYENNLKQTVLDADVAKNGTVLYATKGSKSKSQLILQNTSLKKLITYNCDDGYIVSVAVDSSGKHCAFATVNSKDAKLVTKVFTINSGDTRPIHQFDYTGTDILDLHYSSSDLYVVGSNGVSIISSQKKKKDVLKQGSVFVSKYCYTNSGELVVDYSKYSSSTENTVSYIASSGKVKTNISLKQPIKSISVSSNRIAVLTDNKITAFSLTKGDKKFSLDCDESVSNVATIGNNVYEQRGQLIELKEQ